jgi:hypothetical protein
VTGSFDYLRRRRCGYLLYTFHGLVNPRSFGVDNPDDLNRSQCNKTLAQVVA